MGILDKEVEVKWNSTTIKYYTKKGYVYTKTGNIFKVNIEDLHPNSNLNLNVQCDFCETKSMKRYKNIVNSINNSYSGKYACHSCQGKKMYEENEIKTQLNLATRNDKGYWQFKEHRLKELESFIINNGNSIDFLAIKDRTLYSAIFEYDGSINNLVQELGYSYNDISSISLYGYYKDFDNVKSKIQQFIDKYGRFPIKEEIIGELKIQQLIIDYHGGMYELKRKMNYFNKGDLVDDNGFVNRSSLEFNVAQYLIRNKIPYKREQFPFPKNVGYYRSDFTISTPEKTYQIEVWGYSEKTGGKFSAEYVQRKKVKMDIYSKYNINLISLDGESITRKSMKKVNDYLKNKFSVINNAI